MADEIPNRRGMDVATGEKSDNNAAAVAAQGGAWSPAPWFPMVAAVLGGAVAMVAPLLVAPAVTAGAVLAAVLTGASTGLLGYFGIKSAGAAPPRK